MKARTRVKPGLFSGPSWAGRRVGLLGGSFNPAHRGHAHVSREALRRLELDEVWWLVTPQNPLKPVAGMAPLAERMESAQHIARHPKIRVLDIERALGTRYTIDTLDALRLRFPRVRFVWLMGADNLLQIRRWRRWRGVFRAVSIAVLDRPGYSQAALRGLAAHRYRRRRVGVGPARLLAAAKPPAWAFLPIRLDPTSATQIRRQRAAGRAA